MILRDLITNEMIKCATSKISELEFTTKEIIKILQEQESKTLDYLQEQSPTHWKSVIGKAISRFAIETNEIEQIMPPSKIQARWKKL